MQNGVVVARSQYGSTVPRANEQFVGGRGQKARVQYFADESSVFQLVDRRNLLPMGESSMSATIQALESVQYIFVLSTIRQLEDVFPFVQVTKEEKVGQATVYMVVPVEYRHTEASDYSVDVAAPTREFAPERFNGSGMAVGINFNITDPNNDGLRKEIMSEQKSALTAAHNFTIMRTVVAMRSHSTKYLNDSISRKPLPAHETLNLIGRLEFTRLGACLSTMFPLEGLPADGNPGVLYMVGSSEIIATMAQMLLQKNLPVSREELGALRYTDPREPHHQLDRVSNPKYMSVNLSGTNLVFCPVVCDIAKRQVTEESYIYEGFVVPGNAPDKMYEIGDYKGHTQTLRRSTFVRRAKDSAPNNLGRMFDQVVGRFTLIENPYQIPANIALQNPVDAIIFNGQQNQGGNPNVIRTADQSGVVGNLRAKYTRPDHYITEYVDMLMEACSTTTGIPLTKLMIELSSQPEVRNLYYYIRVIGALLGPAAMSSIFTAFPDAANITEQNHGRDANGQQIPNIDQLANQINDTIEAASGRAAVGNGNALNNPWPPGSVGHVITEMVHPGNLPIGYQMMLLIVARMHISQIPSDLPMPFNIYVGRRTEVNVHHALFVENKTVVVNISSSLSGNETNVMIGQQSLKYYTHILPLVLGLVVDVPIFVETIKPVSTVLGDHIENNVILAAVADDYLADNPSDDTINDLDRSAVWNGLFGTAAPQDVDDDERLLPYVPLGDQSTRAGRVYHPDLAVMTLSGATVVRRVSQVVAAPFERPAGFIPKSVPFDIPSTAAIGIR